MTFSEGGRLADVYTLGALEGPSGETVEPALSGTKIGGHDILRATSEQLLHHKQPLIRSDLASETRIQESESCYWLRKPTLLFRTTGKLTLIIVPCIQKLTELS